MMRIRVTSPFVENTLGLCRVGQELEVPDHQAIMFVRGKLAELVIPEASPETGAGDPRWPTEFRIAPLMYLKRFPNGPSADLARQIVGVT